MRFTDKRIVVTGGAGFIGSHLVDVLLSAGNEVVVIDNFSVGKRANLLQHQHNDRLSIVDADVCDLDAMLRLTKGAYAVFHLACSCLRSSLSYPLTSHHVNATGTLYACQASVANNVERFVFTSSAEVYGNAATNRLSEATPMSPTHTYGASKAAAELYALAYHRCYDLSTVTVRLFNTYGPRASIEGARAEVIPRFVLGAMAGRSPVIFGAGSQTRCFTWVHDIVRGIMLAAESDVLVGDVVQIGSEDETSIADLAHLVLRKVGREDLPIRFLGEDRPADIELSCADNRKARDLLRFEPAVDLETGLDRYIAWVRRQDLNLEAWCNGMLVRNWLRPQPEAATPTPGYDTVSTASGFPMP